MYRRSKSKKRYGVKKRSRKGIKSQAWAISRRDKFAAGPLGGVRPGRFGTTQTISYSPGTPDRAFICLKRIYHGSLGTGAAGAAVFGFVITNSANDPLGTLGSGPPVGGSQWLGVAPSIYSAYIVHASKVTIEFTTVASITPVISMSSRPRSMLQPTTVTQAGGQPRGKCMLTQIYQRNKMSVYNTTAQVYGQSPQTVAIADSFSALYNADPTSETVLDIGIQDPTGTTQLSGPLQLEIIQYIECFGRVTST